MVESSAVDNQEELWEIRLKVHMSACRWANLAPGLQTQNKAQRLLVDYFQILCRMKCLLD